MRQIKTLASKIASVPGAAVAVALLGAALYAFQAYLYAHQLTSTIDEGNYLYKGYLFATGVYRPFQDYGPWTNKMPLAFLIPGWGQVLMGPGLRSGRYFAILLSLLMLAGLWLTARRLGGRWWAAGAVWAMALNPTLIMIYSQALSQGVVACLMAWTFALTLGKGLRPWQTMLGAALAAAVVLTRNNMLPVVIFVLIYIFWENGWRAGLWATLAAFITLAAGHAPYWPKIFQVMWMPFLPHELSRQVIDVARPVVTGDQVWQQSGISLDTQLFILWEGVRFYFIPLAGAFFTWILWPKKESWQSQAHFRVAVVLSVLLVIFTAAHAWASLGAGYCVFCFTIYLAFFIQIGLLLVVVSFKAWERQPGFFRRFLAALAVISCSTGIAYAAYSDIYEPLLNIPVPRMRSLRILPGTTDLWRLLANKFDVSFDFLKVVIPTAAGLLVGVLLVAAVALYCRRMTQKGYPLNAGYLCLVLFFAIGAVLSPGIVLSGGSPPPDCGDILASYERIGAHLAGRIPAGALVDWRGGLSPAPLLYLRDIRIFPPQLNDGYSLRLGGKADDLYKSGYWNEELSLRWLGEADYVLAEARIHKAGLDDMLRAAGRYEELEATPALVTCQYDSEIRIFRRIP